jgi:hypothetical protein
MVLLGVFDELEHHGDDLASGRPGGFEMARDKVSTWSEIRFTICLRAALVEHYPCSALIAA